MPLKKPAHASHNDLHGRTRIGTKKEAAAGLEPVGFHLIKDTAGPGDSAVPPENRGKSPHAVSVDRLGGKRNTRGRSANLTPWTANRCKKDLEKAIIAEQCSADIPSCAAPSC